MLMGRDPALATTPTSLTHPRVHFAYIKQLWSAGGKQVAFEKLRLFAQSMKNNDDVSLLGISRASKY